MIDRATPADYPAIEELWWASVQETHHFIDPGYLGEIKDHLVKDYLPNVDLHVYREDGRILGFLGVSQECIEMLFVHPSAMRKGIGRALLGLAVSSLGVSRVDVNEANLSARRFYEANEFQVTGRSALDSQGRPYPILHMARPSA